MNNLDCCWVKCAVALFIIILLLSVGDFSFAGNPLIDLLTGKKTEQPVEKPKKKPTQTKYASGEITANDFVYMLSHPDRKKVRSYWESSDKSLTFIEYMKGYDKRYVKILKVNQQLQFSGLSYKCYCSCVKPGYWNEHTPEKGNIKTQMTLTVNGNTSKCNCSCEQI